MGDTINSNYETKKKPLDDITLCQKDKKKVVFHDCD